DRSLGMSRNRQARIDWLYFLNQSAFHDSTGDSGGTRQPWISSTHRSFAICDLGQRILSLWGSPRHFGSRRRWAVVSSRIWNTAGLPYPIACGLTIRKHNRMLLASGMNRDRLSG